MTLYAIHLNCIRFFSPKQKSPQVSFARHTDFCMASSSLAALQANSQLAFFEQDVLPPAPPDHSVESTQKKDSSVYDLCMPFVEMEGARTLVICEHYNKHHTVEHKQMYFEEAMLVLPIWS